VTTTSKREAERMLRDWTAELEAQFAAETARADKPDTSKLTFGECIDEYIDYLTRAQKLRPHTIDNYKKELEYARRAFGDRPISELTYADFEKFYFDMRDHGGADGKPLQANTVRKTSIQSNVVFKRAVKMGWIPYNPIADANPFPSEKPQKTILSEEDCKRLIARLLVFPRRDQATALLLCTCTGMRRSEACALTWHSIDFEQRIIDISKSLSVISKAQAIANGQDGTLWLDDPKTTNGKRIIPMAKTLYDYLRDEKKRQEQYLTYYNCYKGDDTPVCANQHGGYMRPDNMSKFSKNFFIDNGFDPALTLHSLRHSFATHLADKGVPPNQIGQITGQSPLIVMNTYANHRSEDVIAKMATEIDSMMDTETVAEDFELARV
jgi:integrase